MMVKPLKEISVSSWRNKYHKLNANFNRLGRQYIAMKSLIMDIYGGAGFSANHWVSDEEIIRIGQEIVRGRHSTPSDV